MSLPPIRIGTIVSVKLAEGQMGFGETVTPPSQGFIVVKWLYNAQDLQQEGYEVPNGYAPQTYWRTHDTQVIPTNYIIAVNPPLRMAAETLDIGYTHRFQ